MAWLSWMLPWWCWYLAGTATGLALFVPVRYVFSVLRMAWVFLRR